MTFVQCSFVYRLHSVLYFWLMNCKLKTVLTGDEWEADEQPPSISSSHRWHDASQCFVRHISNVYCITSRPSRVVVFVHVRRLCHKHRVHTFVRQAIVRGIRDISVRCVVDCWIMTEFSAVQLWVFLLLCPLPSPQFSTANVARQQLFFTPQPPWPLGRQNS